MAHLMPEKSFRTLNLHHEQRSDNAQEEKHELTTQVSHPSGDGKRMISGIGPCGYPESSNKKLKRILEGTTCNAQDVTETNRTGGNRGSPVEVVDTFYSRKRDVDVTKSKSPSSFPHQHLSSGQSLKINFPIFSGKKSELFANSICASNEHFVQVEREKLNLCKSQTFPAFWRSIKDGFVTSTSSTVQRGFESARFNALSRSGEQGCKDRLLNFIHLDSSYGRSCALEIHKRLVDHDSINKHLGRDDGGFSLAESHCFASDEAKMGSAGEHSGNGLLPSKTYEPGDQGTRDYVDLYKTPGCSLRNLQTLRICTTVESVERGRGGASKFSKTTHDVLVTEKADLDITHKSTVSLQENRTIHGMINPPFFCGKEVLQAAACSYGDKDNDLATLAEIIDLNERTSSEVEAIHNISAGEGSRKHKNDLRALDVKKFHTAAAILSELCESSVMKSEIPDINQEPLTCFAPTTLNDRTLSGSKTESLNSEQLIFHAERLEESSNINSQIETFPLAGSCSRWVERFRLGTSGSQAIGTKSWNLEDGCIDNVNKLLSRIMNYYKTSSEPALHMHLGREAEQLEKSANLKHKESFLVEPVKEEHEISLSHPWIQRWRRREVPHQATKPLPEVVCEPEISFDQDFQAREFPSVGAMALMGKAVTTLPCEFRRKGPLVVWKT